MKILKQKNTTSVEKKFSSHAYQWHFVPLTHLRIDVKSKKKCTRSCFKVAPTSISRSNIITDMGIINLLNFLEVLDDTSLFDGDTDAPILDLWVSKAGMSLSFGSWWPILISDSQTLGCPDKI